ncbi:MAG: hypothetical protein AAGE84_02755 [Cyanobacteria bacterium P01_G01_bin.39]
MQKPLSHITRYRYLSKIGDRQKQNKESSLMDKLQIEAQEGTKRFTIDLRESAHRKLSILSVRIGRSKADIIRMVLNDALADVEE